MKRRTLTPEENRLWDKVARNTKPIAGRTSPEGMLKPPVRKPATATRFGAKLPTIDANRVLTTKAPLAGKDPFCAGDPAMDRRTARGRTPVDASLDLHGHNQVSARSTLLKFLIEARRRHYRCVLVVTGKGGSSRHGRRGQGVLRSAVRRWLADEQFRPLIVRAAKAHPRHGGDGAIYLFLKSANSVYR